MKKRILALLLVLSLFLTGCELTENLSEGLLEPEPEIKEETTLQSLSLVYFPTADLHPLADTALANGKVYSTVYLPPVTYNEKLELIYGCATEVVQQKNSISITPDTARKFSDGSSLTAADIAESFRYAWQNEESPYHRRLKKLTGLSADSGRVVLTFADNDPGAMYCLDIPVVKNIGSEKKPNYIGCGDYAFGKHQNVRALIKSEHAKAEGGLSPIYLLTPDSAEAQVSMFNSGTLSVLSSDMMEKGAFSASRSYKTASFLTGDMIFIGVNNEKISAASRRALSTLVPREDIVSSVLMGLGQAAESPFYPMLSDVPAAAKAADKERLLELFGAAGLVANNGELRTKEGQKPRFKILVCKDTKEHLSVAEKLKNAALSLGIEIEIESVGRDTFLSRLSYGDFELYVARYELGPTMEASELFIGEGAPNYSQSTDPALATAYQNYLDGGSRAEYLAALSRACPILPVAFVKTAVYYTEGITPAGGLSARRPYGTLSEWKIK